MYKLFVKKFKPHDAVETCAMIKRSFRECVGNDCNKNGKQLWLASQNPKRQIERSTTRPMYLALLNGRIVSAVELNTNRISRLFVDPKFHKKGIGTVLIKIALRYYKRRKLKTLKVFSSNFAVPFYKKFGFARFGPKKHDRGITSNPMKIQL